MHHLHLHLSKPPPAVHLHSLASFSKLRFLHWQHVLPYKMFPHNISFQAGLCHLWGKCVSSWLWSYPECHRAHFSRSRCPGQWEGQRGRAVCRSSPPDPTATDRNCWGTDQRDDLWSNPAGGESRDAAITSKSDSVESIPMSHRYRRKTSPLKLGINQLTGSCSSSNKLTTTMLMSVPMVPSLKRLETCEGEEDSLNGGT